MGIVSRTSLVARVNAIIAQAEAEEQKLLGQVERHREDARLAEFRAAEAHTVRMETSKLKTALASALGR